MPQLNASGAGAAYFAGQRAALDALGDNSHAVLPHIGLALTPGGTVVGQINRGELDLAIRELAGGLPLLGRPASALKLSLKFREMGHFSPGALRAPKFRAKFAP